MENKAWGVRVEATLEILEGGREIWRRRQWHPTPVLLPGKSHGWRSLVGCSPWGRWGSEEPTHWKRLWCWEILKVGGEGDDRGWDGWMASPTQWTWVWVSSRNWWWTGNPGMLQSMGLQRVGHEWATKLRPELEHVQVFALLWKKK